MQTITSKDTSLNQVPALFKKVDVSGKVVLDYGAGKFNTGKDYLFQQGAYKVLSYGPYNRSDYENNTAIQYKDTAEIILCANVLNVLHDDSIKRVVAHIVSITHDNYIPVCISVYEGDKSGIGKETTKGWQRNQKAVEYQPLLEKYFIVTRKGNIFYCLPKKK